MGPRFPFILFIVILACGCVGDQKGCPEEYMECADGSYSWRVLPDCEFEPCPELVATTSTTATTLGENENATEGNTTSVSSSCRFNFASTVESLETAELIKVSGCSDMIRLSLVSVNNSDKAYNITSGLCEVGSEAIVMQDMAQQYDKDLNMLALVYCKGNLLNEELLKASAAVIDEDQCNSSSFAGDDWVKRFGC